MGIANGCVAGDHEGDGRSVTPPLGHTNRGRHETRRGDPVPVPDRAGRGDAGAGGRVRVEVPAARRAGGQGAGAGRERRHPPRHRPRLLRHAGRALGLRLPDRRGGGDRRRRARGDLTRWRGVRHLVRGATPRGARPRCPRTGTAPAGGDGPARHGHPSRDGQEGRVAAGGPGHPATGAGRRGPVRGGTRARGTAGPGAVRGPRGAGGSGLCQGQRPGARARARSGGQPRLGEPLPRGPGRRRGVRPGGGGADGGARRRGVRDDPLRLARAGPPDLYRPRPRHGWGHGGATASGCPTANWRAPPCARPRGRPTSVR